MLQKKTKMNPFLQSIAFRFLVIWHRVKRFFTSARFYMSSWWSFIFGSSRSGAARRGKSAPSLDAPPAEMVKPLETRIVKAYGTCKTTDPDASNEMSIPHWMDMTSIFRTVVSDITKNQAAPRPDIFISSLSVLNDSSLINVGKLLVSYKNGMSSHTVCYYDDGPSSVEGGIVFPPSVKHSTTTMAPLSLDSAIDSVKVTTQLENREATNGHELVVTSYFKQFSGPARDFYEGAPYATRPVDIYHALILFHVITSNDGESFRNFIISYKDGKILWVPTTSTTPICEVL